MQRAADLPRLHACSCVFLVQLSSRQGPCSYPLAQAPPLVTTASSLTLWHPVTCCRLPLVLPLSGAPAQTTARSSLTR